MSKARTSAVRAARPFFRRFGSGADHLWFSGMGVKMSRCQNYLGSARSILGPRSGCNFPERDLLGICWWEGNFARGFAVREIGTLPTRRNRIWLLAVSTVCFAAVANVQNPDDVRLLIDETNAPVSHAQPQLAPLACQHLYVARARLGKPFDGLLHLVPVAVWQPFQIPGRLRAKQDSLHAPLRRRSANGMS